MSRGVLLLLAGLAGPPQGPGAGFDAALRLVAEGRYAAALEAAEAEPDGLRRAQARVHVRHRAGDLAGALAAALAGLEADPSDPWLLEQAAFVAVSLNRGAQGEALAERLARAVQPAGAADPGAPERAEGLLAEARAARALELARRDALARSRRVALGLLAASLLLGAFLARPTASAE